MRLKWKLRRRRTGHSRYTIPPHDFFRAELELWDVDNRRRVLRMGVAFGKTTPVKVHMGVWEPTRLRCIRTYRSGHFMEAALREFQEAGGVPCRNTWAAVRQLRREIARWADENPQNTT